MSSFNAKVIVSDMLERSMVSSAQSLAMECIMRCADKYGFDGKMAMLDLGLNNVVMERKQNVKAKKDSSEKAKKEEKKLLFPLPYSGEYKPECCVALRQNNGLYTQCQSAKNGESKYCKGCEKNMQKACAEVPEYGTIQDRMSVGIMEYVDPKGRKPVAYTKVMKKYKLTEEQVRAEAEKLGQKVADIHFVVPAEEGKRGRPASNKEKKEKGVKGRPKKDKRVLIEEDDEEDLFAMLVAHANAEEEEEKMKKEAKKDEEKAKKEEEKAKKEEEKKQKEEEKKQKEEEKKQKEAEKAAEKAKKEEEKAKKEEEKAKKAAEKAKKEEEKVKKAAEKAKKEEEKTKKEEDGLRCKKLTYEGKTYLKVKTDSRVLDFDAYVADKSIVEVGRWIEEDQKIEFFKQDEDEDEDEDEEEEEEEEEDEYDIDM